MTADQIDLLEADIDSKLVAAGRAIEARRMRAQPPPAEVVVKVAAPPSDYEIEATICALMAESFREAQRCFQLVGRAATVEEQGIYTNRATRLCGAFSELSMALSRHRGQPRLMIEHTHVHKHVRLCEAAK